LFLSVKAVTVPVQSTAAPGGVGAVDDHAVPVIEKPISDAPDAVSAAPLDEGPLLRGGLNRSGALEPVRVNGTRGALFCFCLDVIETFRNIIKTF
jgi:hypothetical protein